MEVAGIDLKKHLPEDLAQDRPERRNRIHVVDIGTKL